jgi:hypothetical protein
LTEAIIVCTNKTCDARSGSGDQRQGTTMSTAIESIGAFRSGARDSTGSRVAEGSDVPKMRARSGTRGSDAEMIKLLADALESLADASCSFWACDGPKKPRNMVTCTKCWAMRNIATVKATLEARKSGKQAPV